MTWPAGDAPPHLEPAPEGQRLGLPSHRQRDPVWVARQLLKDTTCRSLRSRRRWPFRSQCLHPSLPRWSVRLSPGRVTAGPDDTPIGPNRQTTAPPVRNDHCGASTGRCEAGLASASPLPRMSRCGARVIGLPGLKRSSEVASPDQSLRRSQLRIIPHPDG